MVSLGATFATAFTEVPLCNHMIRDRNAWHRLGRGVCVLFATWLVCGPALAQETLNWMRTNAGGYSMIPNETRDFYIQQKNYTTVGATFSITGGTIVGAGNGFVTVRAPAAGSACDFVTRPATLVVSRTN